MPAVQSQYETRLHPEPKSEVIALVSRVIDQKRMISRIVAWSFALITIAAFLIPNSYESTVRLMPPEKQQLGGLAAMLAAAGSDSSAPSAGIGGLLAESMGMRGSGALYVGVLKSATVQDALVDQFNLLKVYHVRYRKDARKELSQRTEVVEDRKSGIIAVTVVDHSPKRATELAAAYVVTLNQLTAQLNTSGAHRERLFLEDRLKNVTGS